ncbi:MAG: hypothetical protein ACLUKE_08265 [Blautia wexlerae]
MVRPWVRQEKLLQSLRAGTYKVEVTATSQAGATSKETASIVIPAFLNILIPGSLIKQITGSTAALENEGYSTGSTSI